MRRIGTLNEFFRAVGGSNQTQTAKLLDMTEEQLKEAFKANDQLTTVYRTGGLDYALYIGQKYPPLAKATKSTR